MYLMKLIQSMLQRAETIFFLTSWMVGRHIPSSGGNCLPRLLKTLSAFPICDFYSNLDQHTTSTYLVSIHNSVLNNFFELFKS